MFSKEVIGKMKKGAYLVNNARGAIVDREAVVEACKSGQLGGEPVHPVCPFAWCAANHTGKGMRIFSYLMGIVIFCNAYPLYPLMTAKCIALAH